MLTVVTGNPGSGKTLWTIAEVEKIREGRPVYYSGIPDLELDWHELEQPTKWHMAPEGAIIVLDEFWQVFPASSNPRAPCPPDLEPMATHRHRGHDVFIVTQHSTQIHTFPRKMAGRHIHLLRRFGKKVATVWEWPEIANERDTWDRKKAKSYLWRHATDFYGKYKSTVLDTTRSSLPLFRIAGLLAGIVLVPLLLWGGVAAIWPESDQPTNGEETGVAPRLSGLAMQSAMGEPVKSRPNLYAAETWTPEVAEIPHSAGFYDELVRPVAYPRVSGCSRLQYGDGKDDCRCFDQQGNRLRIGYRQCLDYMQYGAFDFSKPDSHFEPRLAPVQDTSVSPVIPQTSASGAGTAPGGGG